LRGNFCSGTKVPETIISTTIFDMKGIKLKTTKVKRLVVIRIFVGVTAQYWDCNNCQYTNCESQSNESKVKSKIGFKIGFGEVDVISGKTNNNNSKDRSENWGRG
jgi:hypothetical protein